MKCVGECLSSQDEHRQEFPPLGSSGSRGTSQVYDASSHSTTKLPSLRPFSQSPATPITHESGDASSGLARYFHGLAAGDDLSDLIRGLRGSLARCYHDCTQERKNASTFATPPSSGDHKTIKGKEENVAASVASGAPLDPAPSPVAATPHPLPPGTLSASQRREYWTATKAAFLFAVESPAAGEEATILHCSPVTRSVLYPYYYAAGADNHTSTTAGGAALPLTGVLRGGDMTMILSDVRMAELAREAVRRNPSDGWRTALQLLHQVVRSPLTCAVELEMYRHTNGHHWTEALRCLWSMQPPQWTEMDVVAVLRCLYYAGRRARDHDAPLEKKPSATLAVPRDGSADAEDASGAPGESSELLLARLIAQALRVHRAVEESSTIQWSTPSAVNDLLGLLAQDAGSWQEACLLLDKLLDGQASNCVEVDGTAALLRENNEKATDRSEDIQVCSTTSESTSKLYQLVRPNAVTVHQVCRALRHHPEVGLRYVRLLRGAAGEAIDLFSDITATEDVLRLCIAGQRWQDALGLVTQHEASIQRSNAAALNEAPSAEAAAPSSPRRGIPAQLPHQRQHYRPDIFVQLVRLLGSAPGAREAAYRLVQRHDTAASAPRTAPSTSRRNGSPIHSELSASKYYNHDTLSRAYNCLLQGSATLAAADVIVEQLNTHYGTTALRPMTGSTQPAVRSQDLCGDVRLAGLETESVAHIAYLASVAGDWQRALHHTNTLLHSPRYQATFFPTARLHDAVQYALEQAPPPGPSWQVSMRLFTEMVERHVPNSEVSFQSVVKRCFAGGAPEQAQRLFQLVLKRGVRS